MDISNIDDDPFTIVREFFWTVLSANPFFASWVREGNRCAYDNEIGEKRNIGHGDLPEVVVVPVSMSQDSGMGSSNYGYLNYTFLVHMTTGTKNTKMISALQWELFRVIQTFCARIGTLRYHESPISSMAKLESGSQAYANSEYNRGIAGWTATWGVRVEMQFKNSELIYNITEG